jgi:hypothetical protein
MHRLDRRRFAVAAISFGATFPAVLGYAAVQAGRAGAPAVHALGAGDDLSILVTAGPARLLIATGTDTTAFGNALASALPFLLRRIDVVLLAGAGRSAAVASHAMRSVHGRAFAIVDPNYNAFEGKSPSERRTEAIIEPRSYELPLGVSVTVESAVDDEQSGWRATIVHELTRVVVVPDGRLAKIFSWYDPISALIVTGDRPAEAVVAARTPAVVVNAESVSVDALREEMASIAPRPLWMLQVFAGESKAIEFVDSGLRLPTADAIN